MPVAANQTIKAPPRGKAQVVFMRSTFVGSAISASLFDVTSGSPKFMGVIQNGNKIVYTVKPGKRNFMVVSEAADFMPATLSANKTYYAMVTPRMGAWKARFSIRPIRRVGAGDYTMKSDKFQKWLQATKIVEINQAARDWAKANAPDIKNKQNSYWPKWRGKSHDDKLAATLNANDGI